MIFRGCTTMRLMIKVLCHTCMRAEFESKLRTARKKEPAFVIDGNCNWKKALERFREHQTSACHLLAIDSNVTLTKTCADIGSSLSDVYKKQVAKKRQIFSFWQGKELLSKEIRMRIQIFFNSSNSEPMMIPVCTIG